MKGLKKLVLVSAIAAAPFAQAELKAIDDAVLADVTGQSGLIIEVAMGSTDAFGARQQGVLTITSTGLDAWDNAGIKIDAFKWEVDLGGYDSATNIHANDNGRLEDGGGNNYVGGLIASDIRIAGSLDMTIDGVLDASDISTGGGIAIGFEESNISMRINSLNVYGGIEGQGQAMLRPSMGAIEIIGMDLSNLDLTISGRGE